MADTQKKSSKHSLRNILLVVGILNLIPAGIIFAGIANPKKDSETTIVAVPPVAGGPGSVVAVDLTLNNNTEGWITGGFVVNYEGNLKPELDAEDGVSLRYENGLASRGLACEQVVDTNGKSVALAYAGTSVNKKEGIIGTIYFQIPNDAKVGDTYDLSMTADRFCTRYSGETQLTPINYKIQCGTIQVSAISHTALTFYDFGETQQLWVKTDKPVTWSSSDSMIAPVSADGLVTAGRSGTAVITAAFGDETLTCNVTVGEYDFNRYRGNIDGNEKVNTTDAILALKATAANILKVDTGLTQKQNVLCDVNEDNSVNASDAVLILKYYSESMAGSCRWKDILK